MVQINITQEEDKMSTEQKGLVEALMVANDYIEALEKHNGKLEQELELTKEALKLLREENILYKAVIRKALK